jgi:2-polyprenyl-6-methoxyphenol hydroxylase-like FAD-dependent oxidoreductase
MILARALVAAPTPEQGFALYQQTREARVLRVTERSAMQGRLYAGEPDENTLRGGDERELFAHDAMTIPLGSAS